MAGKILHRLDEHRLVALGYGDQRAFQKLPGSRASVFAQIDAPALMALPVQPWEWAVFKTVRVHIGQPRRV